MQDAYRRARLSEFAIMGGYIRRVPGVYTIHCRTVKQSIR
jgi:hypothetical protein